MGLQNTRRVGQVKCCHYKEGGGCGAEFWGIVLIRAI